MQTPRTVLAPLVMLGLLTALGAPSAQTGQPPQSPDVFRRATTLVPVDVRVIDRNGKPVTDLAQSDFTVLENGVAQSIRHFSTQELTAVTPQAGSTPFPRAAEGGGIAGQDRRIFLIVLARGRLNDVGKGVDGMLHFVRERLLPQDLVAVLAWNRSTDFTTDHARILDVLERFKRAHKDIESRLSLATSGLAALYGSKQIPASLQKEVDAVFGGPGARGVRSVQPGVSPNASRLNDDTRQTVDELLAPPSTAATPDAEALAASLDAFVGSSAQTMQDLGNMYVGVEYLRHIEGEKHLVFVSAAGLALPRAEDDLDLAAAASDARVVIDYIHTSGTPMGPEQQMFTAENRGSAAGRPALRPALPMRAAQPEMWKFATARTLADRTGGHFYANQFPDAAADMDHVDRATRFGYVLGYYASNPSMDGKYRRIAVRVNRPGLTVLYRHGYFARPALAPINLARRITYSRIAAAANYAGAVTDINVQATASMLQAAETPQGLAVRLDIRIDPSRLAFTKRDGRNVKSLDLAVFLVDGSDRLVGEGWKTVELTFTDDRLAAVTREGLAIGLTITVSAPPKHAKVVVYDADVDLVGSAIVKMP